MYEYKKGDKATCKCGHQITYTGEYWVHDGQSKPRHPGFPAVMKPVIVENFADNGAHSHWSVINSITGKIIIRNIMDI